MKKQTVEVLNLVNQQFYQANAVEFSTTRQSSWKGWNRLLKSIEWSKIRALLDIGCGNGRFRQFLNQHSFLDLEYTGIDNNAQLLIQAQKIPGVNHFLHKDVLKLSKNELGVGYDAITLFGVYHHIPGLETRTKLLNSLASSLNPEGYLIFSVWKFAESQRFTQKIISWNQAIKTLPSIDTSDLDQGDYLLNWNQSQHYRYCHFASSEEIDILIDSLPLKLLDKYRADGQDNNLNEYLVFQKQ